MPAPTAVTPEFDTIATKVKEHIEAITNPPKVYLRQRGKHFWDEVMSNQVIASQLNVWEITFENMNTIIPVEGGGTGNLPLRERTYQVMLTGRLAFRDGSDTDNSTLQFNHAIESIENKLITDYFLKGGTDTATLLKPIIRVDARVNDFIMYGSVLVHFCEMVFMAKVRKQGL